MLSVWRKLVVIFSHNRTDLKITPGTQQSSPQRQIFCPKVKSNIFTMRKFRDTKQLPVQCSPSAHYEMSLLSTQLCSNRIFKIFLQKMFVLDLRAVSCWAKSYLLSFDIYCRDNNLVYDSCQLSYDTKLKNIQSWYYLQKY